MTLQATGSTLGVGLPELEDKLVKVSLNDTTAGVLFDKIESSDASIAIAITGGGGDEKLNITTIGGGEANTASNLGAGAGVFESKLGVDLRFKSLTTTGGIVINSSGTELELDTSGIGGGTLDDAYDFGGAGAGRTIISDTGAVQITGAGGLDCDGPAVFNEAGNNVDLRIEGLTDPNLFFSDASADSIGIGTIPTSKFHVSLGTDNLNVDTSGEANLFKIVGVTEKVQIGGLANTAKFTVNALDASHQHTAYFKSNAVAAGRATVFIQNLSGGHGLEIQAVGTQNAVEINTSGGTINYGLSVVAASASGLNGTVSTAGRVGVTGNTLGTSCIALDAVGQGLNSTLLRLRPIAKGNTFIDLLSTPVDDTTFKAMDFNISSSLTANNTNNLFFFKRFSGGAGNFTGDFFLLEDGAGTFGNTFHIKQNTVSRFRIDGTGNLRIGPGLIGANSVNVVSHFLSTAPTTNPADISQMYVLDRNGAGTAAHHFENEQGHVVILFQGAVLTAIDATATDGTIGTNDTITNNIRTRLNELEARVQAAGQLA